MVEVGQGGLGGRRGGQEGGRGRRDGRIGWSRGSDIGSTPGVDNTRQDGDGEFGGGKIGGVGGEVGDCGDEAFEDGLVRWWEMDSLVMLYIEEVFSEVERREKGEITLAD